jgi:hypothetical protein
MVSICTFSQAPSQSHLADRLRAHLVDRLRSLFSGGERDLEKMK